MNRVNLTAILCVKDTQTLDRNQIDNLIVHGVDRVIAVVAGLKDTAVLQKEFNGFSELYIHRLHVREPGCWITPALDWATSIYGTTTEWIVPVIGDETFNLALPELSSFLPPDAAALGILYEPSEERLRCVKMVARTSRIVAGWLSPFTAPLDGPFVYVGGEEVEPTYDMVRADAPGPDFVLKTYTKDYLFYGTVAQTAPLPVTPSVSNIPIMIQQARNMNPFEEVKIV